MHDCFITFLVFNQRLNEHVSVFIIAQKNKYLIALLICFANHRDHMVGYILELGFIIQKVYAPNNSLTNSISSFSPLLYTFLL